MRSNEPKPHPLYPWFFWCTCIRQSLDLFEALGLGYWFAVRVLGARDVLAQGFCVDWWPQRSSVLFVSSKRLGAGRGTDAEELPAGVRVHGTFGSRNLRAASHDGGEVQWWRTALGRECLVELPHIRGMYSICVGKITNR